MEDNGIQAKKHTSVWLDTTPQTTYPTQKSNRVTDVVVIGGGIAGISTAYLLTKAGLKVTLLERYRIVESVTGLTTAKITSNHHLFYAELTKKYGAEKAQMYADAQQRGLETIAAIVKKERIDCDFKRTESYTYGEVEKERDHIQKEVQAAKKLKLPVSFVKEADLPYPTFGAIRYTNQAQFHPRKYLLALADRIVKDNGTIYEDTQALDLKEEKDHCRVITTHGEIKAKFVVVATHFPFYDHALFFARMSPFRDYVIGVTIKEKVPSGMYIGAGGAGFSLRNQPMDKGTLLIIGGQDHKTGHAEDTVDRYKRLESFAVEHFSVSSYKYFWSTQDYMTLDKVPYIGRLTTKTERMFVTTGFGGWGMTNGTASGLLITDFILGKKNDWADIFNPHRNDIQKNIKATLSQGIDSTKSLIAARIQKRSGRVQRKKDSGEVITKDGKKLAVYKDKKGHVHVLSATCTHMGCIVTWNQAEKSWDCPCHGSRFDTNGKPLEGPAQKALEKQALS